MSGTCSRTTVSISCVYARAAPLNCNSNLNTPSLVSILFVQWPTETLCVLSGCSTSTTNLSYHHRIKLKWFSDGVLGLIFNWIGQLLFGRERGALGTHLSHLCPARISVVNKLYYLYTIFRKHYFLINCFTIGRLKCILILLLNIKRRVHFNKLFSIFFLLLDLFQVSGK